MRVLVLTHNLPRFSGDFSGTFVDALCRALANQNSRVDVVAPHDVAYNATFSRPYHLATYKYAWPPSLQTVGYTRSLVGDLKPRPISLLVTPAMLASGVAACLRLIQAQRPDVIHAHWLLPNGLIGAIVSKVTDIPLVVSIPGSDLLVARLNSLTRALARLTLRQAALATANSRELESVAYTLGAHPDRFDLIIYGVDPQSLLPNRESGLALRKRLDIGDSEFVVLAVGRMVPKKGLRYLVEAMPNLLRAAPQARLLLVGNGEQRRALEHLSEQLGVAKKVHFAGVVPRHEIAAYYNAADVLAMPSITEPEDGLNVCVLDAMACAKPIVATTVAGNPLVVHEGVNGCLVPERQPDQLASRLAMLAKDEQKRAAFGAASRKLVEDQFSWSHIAHRYLEHFHRIASLSSGRG
ncbi:MAG: glycosyltransferase [Anaerolineae bacterium]